MEVLKELLLLGLCPRFQEPAPAVGIARVLRHIATVFKISHEKQEKGKTRLATRHRRGKVHRARLPSAARTCCRSCKTSVPRSSSRPSLHTTAKTTRENRRNLTTTLSPHGAHDPSTRRAVLFSLRISTLRLQQAATRLKRPLLLRQDKQGGKEDTPTQPVDALPGTKCRLRATATSIMQ